MRENDIIFISYNESSADKNWLELKSRFPRAKRVHGVKGIINAHRKAAEISESEYFFVVDGDNRIRPDFNFSTEGLFLKQDTLYVWRCFNPVNSLVYGYGAIKLYNKHILGPKKEEAYLDLATTTTQHYHIIHVVASETHFYHTPKEAWRGAFRECAKLASEMIHRQKTKETQERLEEWCSVASDVANSEWCLLGARQGRAFGESLKDNPEGLQKINDFEWLNQEYEKNANV